MCNIKTYIQIDESDKERVYRLLKSYKNENLSIKITFPSDYNFPLNTLIPVVTSTKCIALGKIISISKSIESNVFYNTIEFIPYIIKKDSASVLFNLVTLNIQNEVKMENEIDDIYDKSKNVYIPGALKSQDNYDFDDDEDDNSFKINNNLFHNF